MRKGTGHHTRGNIPVQSGERYTLPEPYNDILIPQQYSITEKKLRKIEYCQGNASNHPAGNAKSAKDFAHMVTPLITRLKWFPPLVTVLIPKDYMVTHSEIKSMVTELITVK